MTSLRVLKPIKVETGIMVTTGIYLLKINVLSEINVTASQYEGENVALNSDDKNSDHDLFPPEPHSKAAGKTTLYSTTKKF